MKKWIRSTGSVVIPILTGLVFCVCGIDLMMGSYLISEKEIEVEGTITDIISFINEEGETDHTALVDFVYNNRKYCGMPLPSYSPSMSIGEKANVVINPDNLMGKQTKELDYRGLVPLAAGLVAIYLGISPLIRAMWERAKEKKYMLKGLCLYAKVDDVKKANYSVEGKTPYIVYCSYEDSYTGTLYKFKSPDLWYIPKAYYHRDTEIRVYVDEKDYSKYYMEVECAEEEQRMNDMDLFSEDSDWW